jgi:hypothetical protein
MYGNTIFVQIKNEIVNSNKLTLVEDVIFVANLVNYQYLDYLNIFAIYE